MDKLLEVREFDSIISNNDYKDDSKYKYLKEPIFNELIEFIHSFDGNGDTADVLDFMRINYKRNIGDIITIRNYVGLVQIDNGYQIHILPKISFEKNDKDNEQTKRLFINMLRCMKDFPSKVFTDSQLKISKMNLYEIFINMYLQEVRKLVKHGLKSSYEVKEDNLHFYKGKLKVSEHIKENKLHKERFYVEFDEYQVNRAENRLVKAALLKLQKLSGSAENLKEIRKLLTAFEMVEPSVNYQKDFSKVVIDRNTKEYEMLIKWSKVFLLNKSFTTFSGKTKSRALLFPMEKVFEAYVAKYIKLIFGQAGWEVSTQDKGRYLFDSPRKQFALRPDIVIKKNDRVIIMDTKWKKLHDNERTNYGIAQSDMYQMYAYSKKYNTPEIWLLYPVNDEMRNHDPIVFTGNDNVNVHVFFVDLANIEDNLDMLRQIIEINYGQGMIPSKDISEDKAEVQ